MRIEIKSKLPEAETEIALEKAISSMVMTREGKEITDPNLKELKRETDIIRSKVLESMITQIAGVIAKE